MSKLEQLIQELCPDGVEYKKFNEVAEYIRGVSYNKSKEINNGKEGHKLLRANNITLLSNELNYDEVKIIDFSVNVKPNQMLLKNDILICAGSGSKEHIGKVAFIEKNINYTFGGFMGVIRIKHNIMNPRYMFHIMTSPIFKAHLSKVSNSSTINNINNDTWKEFYFPVPPLEIQNEIVRILDHFTLLTAELTAELTARQKQYEYYRDKLFEFDETTKFYPLIELCSSIKDGMHNLPKENSTTGEYPILSAQNINYGTINFAAKRYVSQEIFERENKRINLEKNDVLLTIVATIGRTAVVKENSKMLLQRSVCALKCNSKILPYYLKYYLDTKSIQNYMKANAHGSAQAGLYLNQVSEIKVPVPSLEKQRNIIEVLDRFDKLCNDISEGLPAEIEARQKQYEYYRDKLLTFKELKKEN